MAERSGFFNALQTSAGYDRKYNANDYSENLAAIFTDGVRRSGDDELKVNAAGGMNLSINIGRAWIKGRWYINDTIFTSFVVPTAPTGDRSRIDRIVLRLDISVEERSINLVYLTGTVGTSPTAPSLTRTDEVYEIALADIKVNPNVTSITQSDITDQRANADLCGWITSPIGYSDYFKNLDNAFMEWWAGVKDTLASSTLFKPYYWNTTLESTSSSVTFNIPQYDPTGVDILDVYSNGLRLAKNIDYTVNNSIITFTESKIAGTEIAVVVYKSIDGTGLGSVSDEITELQNEMATIKNIGDYIYICNGLNDNVKLSELAASYFENDTAFDQMTITVYGTFGATAPYAGVGSSVSRYRWMSLGSAGSTKKRLVFDFAGCSQITLNCEPSYHYIVFYGVGVNIRNANIAVIHKNTEGSVVMFSATSGYVNAENCRFFIDAYQSSYIAQTGIFTNCYGEVYNARGDSFCFNLHTNGLIRINGGEYLAYTGQDTYNASVVYADSSATNGVVITNAMNCPTIAVTSNYQKNAILCNAGFGAFNDTVTLLTVKSSSGQNVRGTYQVSKQGRM